jgi:hypothetical protein
VRYRSLLADNARWQGLELRPGDIIITTPPKCGTTWTQMLVALLIFDGPEFPDSLDHLSPWVDMQARPVQEVHARYAAQTHRRFLKSHTPLDGLPWRDDVHYVVVGRDPRDVAISMEHHQANMDRRRLLELRAQALGEDPAAIPTPFEQDPDPAQRWRDFVESDDIHGPVSLHAVLRQLAIAWDRRAAANVALFHFADYKADLPGEIARLGRAVNIPVGAPRAEALAAYASLDAMRDRAEDVVPSASLGTWHDTKAFLRAGGMGEWQARVSPADRARYDERVRALAAPDLAAWAHGGRAGSGIDPDTGG